MESTSQSRNIWIYVYSCELPCQSIFQNEINLNMKLKVKQSHVSFSRKTSIVKSSFLFRLSNGTTMKTTNTDKVNDSQTNKRSG
jgi:hypothetical protein